MDSSMSFLLSSAWLIRRTIQSNRALYNDLAMESRAVIAWRNHTGLDTKHLEAPKNRQSERRIKAYLAVAVGQNQLVVYSHCFPLGKSLHQQHLLDLHQNTREHVKPHPQHPTTESMNPACEILFLLLIWLHNNSKNNNYYYCY